MRTAPLPHVCGRVGQLGGKKKVVQELYARHGRPARCCLMTQLPRHILAHSDSLCFLNAIIHILANIEIKRHCSSFFFCNLCIFIVLASAGDDHLVFQENEKFTRR